MRDAQVTNKGGEPADIAIAILGWLSNEPDMLGRFLSLSGLDATDLRPLVSDRGFQAGLLDFVMAHEPSLNAFCSAYGLLPEEVQSAWQKLSGPLYGGTGA